jgi:hypothetical protein
LRLLSQPADPDALELLRVDKEAAHARLSTIIAGALSVVSAVAAVAATTAPS